MDVIDQTNTPEFPVLKTKRLILREVTLSDAEDVFIFRSDPYVQRFNSKPIVDESEAREQITRMKTTYERTEDCHWHGWVLAMELFQPSNAGIRPGA